MEDHLLFCGSQIWPKYIKRLVLGILAEDSPEALGPYCLRHLSKSTSFSIFVVSHVNSEQSLFKSVGAGRLSPRIIFRTYSWEHPSRTAVVFRDQPDFAIPSISFSEKNPSLSMLTLIDPARSAAVHDTYSMSTYSRQRHLLFWRGPSPDRRKEGASLCNRDFSPTDLWQND